jgi:hypothetical protein
MSQKAAVIMIKFVTQVDSKSPLTSLVLVNICGILSVLYMKYVNVGVRTLLELILRRQIVRSKLY